ncbi:FG-GAP repeat domain-containing protein [Georgenia satyanarayanai]|uniref:FG-GAP repeat domain-containing protein n=1 Tax=Georgenia satyanarayanai TaxID=860221 RepID=UPI0011B4527F|nr:VCBS repeat-containing protein [Georgenia satyanarayanai]
MTTPSKGRPTRAVSVLLTGAIAAGLALSVAPAHASTTELEGSWRGRGTERATYSDRAVFSGAGARFTYGRPGDKPLVGDWDGDGRDSLAAHRGHFLFFRNQLSGGDADVTYYYGRTGDVPVVGDWDDDGRDTVSVLRDGVLHVNNKLRGGHAEYTVRMSQSAALGRPEPRPSAEQRTRTVLDRYGCEDVVLEMASPDLGTAVGAAFWEETPQRIAIDPQRVDDLEHTAAHECAHMLQFRAYEEYHTPERSAGYTLWPHLDTLTGSTGHLGGEKLADCMTYRWGFATTGSYTRDQQWCAQHSDIVDALLAGRTPHPAPTPAVSPEPETRTHEQRARDVMDRYGCADVELDLGPLPPEKAHLVGVAYWDDVPQRIAVDPERTRDLERTVTHECAHMLQYDAYVPYAKPGLSPAYALYPHLNEITGLDRNLGAERLADCMTYRWGFAPTGSYTRDLAWCDEHSDAVDALLDRRVPDPAPAVPS